MKKLISNLSESWQKILYNENDKIQMKLISALDKKVFSLDKICPKQESIFRCFSFFEPEDTKVVILGQDPYHSFDRTGNPVANGLAFSTNNGYLAPSLRNIFKELKTDLGITRNDTDFSDIAKQGVLLLNTVLTVSPNRPLSHDKIGVSGIHSWQYITSYVIEKVTELANPVFLLWGKKAQSKEGFIYSHSDNPIIIRTSHPSPYSARRGFFGSKCFSKVNEALRNKGKSEINYQKSLLE